MKAFAWSRRTELVAFFALTFVFSWAIQVPLALAAQGVLNYSPPMALHYLGSVGPLLAAGVVTMATRGLAGCGELFGRVLRWRVEPGYYLIALAPLVVFVVIMLVMWLVSGELPELGLLGEADYLGALGVLPVLLVWMVSRSAWGRRSGGGGSPSRGCRPPAVGSVRRSCSACSGLCGMCRRSSTGTPTRRWGGWSCRCWCPWPRSARSCTNGARGSLLPVIIFHGLFDFFSVWAGAGAIGPGMIMTILMVFWAVRVYMLYGPQNLAPHAKVAT